VKCPSLYPVCSRSLAPCMISKLLPCLFSQSCPLYDVQASNLFVFAVLPPVRSPSLHPVTSNRCPGISNARRGATPAGLQRSREGCPGRKCSPSRYQPIRPPVDIGVVVATGDSSLIRGTPCRQPVCLADMLASGKLWSTVVHPSRLAPLIRQFQCFSMTEKEGPLQLFDAVPLFRLHYGKWRHMLPRDLERTPCRHPCGAESLLTPFYHRQWKRTNCLHHRFDVWLRVTPFSPTHSCR
jgi:hypothetical protein